MGGVSLVCMPWHALASPSIQIGILHAVLEGAGVPVRSHSFHLAFQDRLLGLPPKRGRLSLQEYEDVCSVWGNLGLGEWIFAVEPARPASKERDARYFRLMREQGASQAWLSKAGRVRAVVPAFLDSCATEILAEEPEVVGFTCTYSQTWPAAALAHRLKAARPELPIVFGGASCEGPMGRATLEAFPWVDVVVRGEAEELIVPLAQTLMRGEALDPLPQLLYRHEGAIEQSRGAPRTPDIDAVPVPAYGEWFERLQGSRHLESLPPQVPYETSRGCWWGEKHHCTFCGLNGLGMASRNRSPEGAYEGLATLSRRHGALDFTVVDNILPLEYFESFLPRLAAEADHLSLFYETKANLSRDRVRLLREAGVRTVQPGIESLSTHVLELMRKGVRAYQNVRLLKWCAEEGIHVLWNLLYGFPGETEEDYRSMERQLPALCHLTPPNLGPLAVYRFSPYFDRAEDFGIVLEGPLPHYGLLYDLDEGGLEDLAQSFCYRHVDGRSSDQHLGGIRAEVERWQRDFERNRGGLTYRRGPGFLRLIDTRTVTGSREPVRYDLDEAGAVVYFACDGGANRGRLERALAKAGQSLPESELSSLLEDLLAARLLFQDGDRYVSLALANG